MSCQNSQPTAIFPFQIITVWSSKPTQPFQFLVRLASKTKENIVSPVVNCQSIYSAKNKKINIFFYEFGISWLCQQIMENARPWQWFMSLTLAKHFKLFSFFILRISSNKYFRRCSQFNRKNVFLPNLLIREAEFDRNVRKQMQKIKIIFNLFVCHMIWKKYRNKISFVHFGKMTMNVLH